MDTSAWVEFLRATGSRPHLKLKGLIEDEAELATTEIVVMELLAGSGSLTAARALRSRLLAYPLIALSGLVDFEEAASIYRTCRQSGEMVRSLTDCLIAAVAIRSDVPLLHQDADFRSIARHSELRLEEAR